MYFLLKSETESVDFDGNCIKKILCCPFCGNIMLKKLDSNKYYDKYQCWNVKCEKMNTPFILLKEYIQCEDLFKKICDTCKEPYNREFIPNEKHDLLIKFSCSGKGCETNLNPYCYNILRGEWEGVPPQFINYEKNINTQDINQENNENDTPKIQCVRISKEDLIEFGLKDLPNHNYKIEDTPLLSMKVGEYDKFLKYHKGKFVILVDLPDFIGSLRETIQFNFEHILHKAHQLLIEFIKSSFYTSDDYIIHYFSKPEENFELSNKIIIDYCMKNKKNEIFHYIKVPCGQGYSNIDNYIIGYGVDILERSKIRGFGIVCSEKDYLPLMIIAGYKNVRSFILGIKTPKVYEKYEIPNLKILEIKKFFEILS